MIKKYYLYIFVLLVAIAGASFYFLGNKNSSLITGPSPSISFLPTRSPSPTPSRSNNPRVSISPIPTPTPGALDEQSQRWNTLKGEAYCELKGELKFLNHNVYNNQDARFIYRGVDHPARIITWKVTPDDGLSIGPNLFSKLPLPDGESLINVVLPETTNYKTYELTASINYGRLVDGNIKTFNKDCVGKTTVVLP